MKHIRNMMSGSRVATLASLSSLALLSVAKSFSVAENRAEKHRQALYRFSEAFTAGNFDVLDELGTADYVLHSPLGDLNPEALKAIMGSLRNALTNFRMTREQVLVEHDYAATRTTFSGVFEHDFHGPNGVVPPNGKAFELEVINLFHFDTAGRIVEEWAQFDNLSFMVQLGLMPPP